MDGWTDGWTEGQQKIPHYERNTVFTNFSQPLVNPAQDVQRPLLDSARYRHMDTQFKVNKVNLKKERKKRTPNDLNDLGLGFFFLSS